MTVPSWTIRLSERSSGSTSPRFSRQRRSSAASSSPMMIRASEPPMKERRSHADLPTNVFNLFSPNAHELEFELIEILLIRFSLRVNRISIKRLAAT